MHKIRESTRNAQSLRGGGWDETCYRGCRDLNFTRTGWRIKQAALRTEGQGLWVCRVFPPGHAENFRKCIDANVGFCAYFSTPSPSAFHTTLHLDQDTIGRFHVTSSPPCRWTVNKRSLSSSLCLSTSICSFHHCYLCLPRLHKNHLYISWNTLGQQRMQMSSH